MRPGARILHRYGWRQSIHKLKENLKKGRPWLRGISNVDVWGLWQRGAGWRWTWTTTPCQRLDSLYHWSPWKATQEDIQEKLAEYEEIKNIHLNLDRYTGYLEGYTLVEYETYKDAQAAMEGPNGQDWWDNRSVWTSVLLGGPPKGKRRCSWRCSRGPHRRHQWQLLCCPGVLSRDSIWPCCLGEIGPG